MARIVTVVASCVIAGDDALAGQVCVRLIPHAPPLRASSAPPRALVIAMIEAAFLTRAVFAVRLLHRLASSNLGTRI
jgi:hypothetical protein